MANKPKVHWPTAMTIYFLASAGLALLAYSLRYGSVATGLRAMFSGSLALVIALVIAVIVILWLRRKYETAGRKIVSLLSRVWHLILGWLGAGLASIGLAELLHNAGSPLSLGSSLLGPLAFLSLPNKLFVVIALAGWSVGLAELMNKTELTVHEGGKGSLVEVGRNLRKVVNKDVKTAPSTKPEGAHFVQTEQPVSSHIIRENEQSSRVALGVATLAPEWGKRKVDVDFGLPQEGSGLVIGAPGSGKSLMIQRALLGADRSVPTHFLVTSTKTQDFASTVQHLRDEGFRVGMWDITGATAGNNQFGDQVRWSPVSLCFKDDPAKETAEKLTEAAQKSESRTREEFWAIQTSLLLYPCLRAAFIANKDLEWAYRAASRWSDPAFTEVEVVLEGHGAMDAFHAWVGTRKFLLDMEKRNDNEAIAWKEKAGLSGAGGTGMSIDATLRGFLSRVSTETAYKATADPNLILSEWVRSPNNEVLFMVGDMSKEFTTRSLFSVAMNEMLTEADRFAKSLPGERLPYRFIVFADEMPNLSPVPGIERFFATVRSIGVQIVAFFQSRAGIIEMLGNEKAKILIGASAMTIVMPGINDPAFINDLSVLAGNKQVELNDGVITTQPLIDGSYIVGMQAPNFETGDAGNALAQTKGGFSELKIPWWSLEERYIDRGVVPAQFEEATIALRRKNRTFTEKLVELVRLLVERVKAWIGVRKNSVHGAKDPSGAATDVAKTQGSEAAPAVGEAPFTRSPDRKLVRSTVGAESPPTKERAIVRSTVTAGTREISVPCGDRTVDLFSGEIKRCGDDGFACENCATSAALRAVTRSPPM
jgi:type IV secretion system protein VirD4